MNIKFFLNVLQIGYQYESSAHNFILYNYHFSFFIIADFPITRRIIPDFIKIFNAYREIFVLNSIFD
ncbi:hypothetical protein ASZ90_005976 [hydrocarbon metagenome]|uniref:Uncharacterized protein n=1 Tax=hydrocarbon metagenome TaxID=938273 RepID=A0A0W8FTJ4_9ZZZZ